ncbi:MAG: CvpA family protein [Phycisphaerales bacterium]
MPKLTNTSFLAFSKSNRGTNIDAGDPSPLTRNLLIGLLIGVPVAVVMLWLTTGWVTAVCIGLIGFCVIQGLWRGAAEIVGVVIGLVLALMLAKVLGRTFEGTIGGLTGTKGLLARFVSTLVCGAVIAILVWGVVSIFAKRWMKEKPQWKDADKFAGAGIGAVEGVLLSMVVLWVPLAVRPVANMRATMDRELAMTQGMTQEEASKAVGPLARRVLEIAEDVEKSTVGSVAQSTNPIEDAGAISLAEDFIAVTRDPEAMEKLAKTEVWQRFMNLQSMQQARQLMEQDVTLKPIIESKGVSIDAIRELLESDTTLKILDTTTIVSDLNGMKDELAAAIRQARTR